MECDGGTSVILPRLTLLPLSACLHPVACCLDWPRGQKDVGSL